MEKLTSTPLDTSSGKIATALMSSVESEQNVICAALSPERAELTRTLLGKLSPSDFYDPIHIVLWNCKTALNDGQVANDISAVLDTARKMGTPLDAAYVMGLTQDASFTSSSDDTVLASAKRVKDYSTLRELTEVLGRAKSLAESGTQSHEDVTSYVEDALQNIRSVSENQATGPMHIGYYVDAATSQVLKRMDGEAIADSITTGFKGLDRMITGFTDGDLIVLAARPSIGKTAVSLAFTNSACDGGRDVLYFSTEQRGISVSYRMIASASRVNATHIKRAEFAHGELDRMIEGAQAVSALNMYLDETAEIALPEIRARARVFAQKHPRMMVVVDYLQRLKPHRNADPRIIIGEISTGLKNLARELKCPVLALAQLNRDLEKRTNKRPMLSDLAESGKIEQDADVILFLYRDEMYNPDTKEPGITEVIAGKNRDGATGVVKLSFNKENQHYDDLYTGY